MTGLWWLVACALFVFHRCCPPSYYHQVGSIINSHSTTTPMRALLCQHHYTQSRVLARTRFRLISSISPPGKLSRTNAYEFIDVELLAKIDYLFWEIIRLAYTCLPFKISKLTTCASQMPIWIWIDNNLYISNIIANQTQCVKYQWSLKVTVAGTLTTLWTIENAITKHYCCC